MRWGWNLLEEGRSGARNSEMDIERLGGSLPIPTSLEAPWQVDAADRCVLTTDFRWT
jgi:hypothetical protein